MRTVQSGVKCAKRAQPLEWQICEMDAEWLARQQDPLSATGLQPDQARRPPWVARHWRIGAVLLMVVAIIGDGIWRVAESGINHIETDLRASIEADLWWESMQKDSDPANHATTAQEGLSRPPSGAVHSLTLLDKTAIVQLVTEPTAEQPAFRQTRFYRQTPAGWLRTVPDATVWGEPRQLESSYFRFHFRQNDASLVAEVAPQIDALYAELQHNLGLAPSLEKAVIEVSVAEPTGVMPFPRSARGRLVVPSPAVYRAPVDLSEQEILAQSLALPLISDELERAVAVHRIPPHWQPLLRGLGLWQLWAWEAPLASWRPAVLEWFYVDLPAASAEQQAVLPANYRELCAMHRLWMLAPTVVGIPLKCSTFDAPTWSSRRWAAHVPQMSLDQLHIPLADWQTQALEFPYYPSDTLAVATLMEYAVSVYGVERLPVLLANLAQYNQWETLVPAVFGVPATDFEAGWRTYLAQHYHVSLEHPCGTAPCAGSCRRC